MYSIRRKISINTFKLFDLFAIGACLILSIFAVSSRVTIPPLGQLRQIEISVPILIYFVISLFTWLTIRSKKIRTPDIYQL
jgi:hypothetical protein